MVYVNSVCQKVANLPLIKYDCVGSQIARLGVYKERFKAKPNLQSQWLRVHGSGSLLVSATTKKPPTTSVVDG